MGPRIQYARTNDGVSIAFWTLGEGMPLVLTPAIPFNHIELAWRVPEERRLFERLAQSGKLVHYDSRGSGLSERNVADYSIESLILDLEAVVHSLGLEKFALFGRVNSGPVAITYAARHPERVSRLILQATYARGSDWRETPQLQGLMGLIDKDWELFVQATAHYVYGWSETEAAQRWAAYFREGMTPQEATAAFQAFREFDVADLLSEVRSPTLVLHNRRISWPEVDLSRGLAAKIPGARLALGDGAEALLNAVDEFLGEGEEATATAKLPEGMAVILFADIVDSTALTEELGDAAFRGKARELDASLRAIIRETGGTPVEGKVLGDGVLAVFTSARQAIECALRCNAAGGSVGLRLHLGIHAGDVIREDDPDGRANVYGGAVNIAARIAGASAPGEVLVSDTVRGLARTSAGVGFEDRGEQTLKGIAEPQRLFAVRAREDG